MKIPASHSRAAVRRGAFEVVPLLLGVIPFGLVVGLSAVDAGLGFGGAVSMSAILFAGASQLAAIELLRDGTPTVVIIATILVINLRFAMYSAALAPLVAHEPRRHRALIASLLVDQPFALAMARERREPDGGQVLAYWLGCAVPFWLMWVASTAVGAGLRTTMPTWLPLRAAVPLMFLVILIPTVTDNATMAAAVASGAVAVLAIELPANTGLLFAASAGILVGTAVAERGTPRQRARHG